MKIQFITGNSNKFIEASAILPHLEQLDIDLPEIQDLDPHQIIKAKLEAAFEHHEGPFIVEDTSLYLDCLNSLPGPFIKWFLQALQLKGLYELAEKHNNFQAKASTLIGYAKNRDKISFFEGSLSGIIVQPRGKEGFGFDPIFQPEGYKQTLAEMTAKQKNQISSRRLALERLQTYLGDGISSLPSA